MLTILMAIFQQGSTFNPRLSVSLHQLSGTLLSSSMPPGETLLMRSKNARYLLFLLTLLCQTGLSNV